MTVVINGTTDFVQLPVDATGKKAAARLVTLNGASIYLPASLVVDETGNTAGPFVAGAVPVTGGSATAGAVSTAGTFTATDAAGGVPDGTGTLVSIAPTSGSTVAVPVTDGMIGSLFLVKGLAASQTALTVYFEGSVNSTTGSDGDWVELKQRRTGTQPGVETADYKTQANGYFRGNCATFRWLRARLIGAFTAGVTVQIATSAGQGATFFNSGLPGGSSVIGITGAQTYNGAAFENQRSNTESSVFASAARTATVSSATQTNTNARGLLLTVAVTAVTGVTPTMTTQLLTVIGGSTVALTAATTALTAAGTQTILLYPGAGAAANGVTQATSYPLPRSWVVRHTIGGTTPSFTFSTDASLIL